MSIQSEITRLSGNVSAALTAIGAKGVTIPSGANSDDLATLIGAIETGKSMWKDKKICVFGDSIGAGYGMTNNYSFVDILDDEGIFESVHKNCVSGSTSITWYTRLQESSTQVAAADIVYADYEGNDINGLIAGTSSTSDFVTNLRLAMTYLRSINATCNVVWLPLTILHADKVGGNNASYYKAWSNAMYPAFAELGINMLPIYDTLGAGHAQQDGRHPNAAGHQVIADLIKQNPLGYSIYPTGLVGEWTGGSY